MRKTGILTAVVLFITLFFITESFAQMGMGQRGSRGWGSGSKYGRMYNPNTVETISCEVIKVDKITPMSGMSYGVHLLVKMTDKEEIPVHLGPGWFIENQEMMIGQGDKIEVKGSKVTFQGKPAIIAAEVKKGEHVLILRDENGFPTWSGWRRGGQGRRGGWR